MNNKTTQILKGIGCHSVTSYADEYRAALPHKTNKTAVCVKKDNLYSRIYTSSQVISGDIISIVMEIVDTDFKNALKTMHNILGLPFVISLTPKTTIYNPLAIFENAKSGTSTSSEKALILYDDNVLDHPNYVKLPHMLLVNEGIVPNVQNEFNVMYDMKDKRILFPHRHWSTGDILGIFGRTIVEDWKLLDIPKYFGTLPYSKSLNLYGLYENYKSIQEYGYVVVFEGEKSVLKAKSLGFPIGVSLGGHEMSDEQIRILIGLDVDIIIAMDADVDKQTSIDMCNNFQSIRSAYYLYNQYDLLDEKDAPIDKGIKRFEYLLKHKEKVV